MPNALLTDPAHGDALPCWVGSLSALGYPPTWVMARAGQRRYTRRVLNGGATPPETTEAVREVFLDHRDQHALDAPGTGLSRAQIRRAIAYAEDHGWRTPDWYDRDGNQLTHRDHEFLVRARRKRERARRKIEVLRLITCGLTDIQISEKTGRDTHDLLRVRYAAGLTGFVDNGRWRPDRNSQDRFRELTRALDEHFRCPGADPYVTLVRLGVLKDPKINEYIRKAY